MALSPRAAEIAAELQGNKPQTDSSAPPRVSRSVDDIKSELLSPNEEPKKVNIKSEKPKLSDTLGKGADINKESLSEIISKLGEANANKSVVEDAKGALGSLGVGAVGAATGVLNEVAGWGKGLGMGVMGANKNIP